MKSVLEQAREVVGVDRKGLGQIRHTQVFGIIHVQVVLDLFREGRDMRHGRVCKKIPLHHGKYLQQGAVGQIVVAGRGLLQDGDPADDIRVAPGVPAAQDIALRGAGHELIAEAFRAPAGKVAPGVVPGIGGRGFIVGDPVLRDVEYVSRLQPVLRTVNEESPLPAGDKMQEVIGTDRGTVAVSGSTFLIPHHHDLQVGLFFGLQIKAGLDEFPHKNSRQSARCKNTALPMSKNSRKDPHRLCGIT